MKSPFKKSFKTELLIWFLVVSLVPMVLLGTFLISMSRSQLKREYEIKTLAELENVETAIAGYCDEIHELANKISKSPEIKKGIMSRDSWIKNKAYVELYDLTNAYRSQIWFDIYDVSGKNVFSTTSRVGAEILPSYWGILKTAKSHPDQFELKKVSQYSENDGVRIEGAKAILNDDEECIGYVVLGLTDAGLKAMLEGSYDSGSCIAVLDEFWEEIYSTNEAKERNLAQILRERRMNGESIKQDSDELVFYISKLDDLKLYIVLGREHLITGEITRTMYGVMSIMAVVSLGLCLLAAGIITGFLLKPIKDMRNAMKVVREGDLHVRVDNRRTDELGELAESFNLMTGRLEAHIETQIAQQKELNESNIAMMQAQLNPHFLYNTLDTIKWGAKEHGADELASLVSNLAKLLRTSISGNQFITLKQEMELVNNYINIQNIRFKDGFTYDEELPMELEDVMVPKLIVQPIVENAIIHGLSESNRGHIFVNIWHEFTGVDSEEILHIDVEDDGKGFDEDILKALNSSDKNELKGHIGFKNADTIIRLNYGEKYGIKAANQEKGAIVSIIMPILNYSDNQREILQ